MNSGGEMGFIPMVSITKNPDDKYLKCSDWVATEKVHGSSFQFYSCDGIDVKAGSRRRNLDDEDSFIRCDIKELTKKYKGYVLKTWQLIHSRERWEQYRERPSTEFDMDDDDVSVIDEEVAAREEEYNASSTETNDKQSDPKEICRMRVYGELFGGGGIDLPETSAAQVEIIYCDEFRFYVFGLTINEKWVNIMELNDLCREAGFPYYAKPVCEPMANIKALKKYLKESGFMGSRSSLTEKPDDNKTYIEGVVMTPLKRPDFGLHAVKFLAEAFVDVRTACFGSTQTANYCTKQRYHSVISKLDIPERNDTSLVVNMYIEDILKETNRTNVDYRLKEKWGKLVIDWLAADGYDTDTSVIEEIVRAGLMGRKTKVIIPTEVLRNAEEEEKKRVERKSKKDNEEADDESLGMNLFDS